jgi:hypothetical protein
MTIRDYIKRRARWNWGLLVIILLAASIAAAVVSTLIIKLDMKTTGTIISLSTTAIILCRQMHIKLPEPIGPACAPVSRMLWTRSDPTQRPVLQNIGQGIHSRDLQQWV